MGRWEPRCDEMTGNRVMPLRRIKVEHWTLSDDEVEYDIVRNGRCSVMITTNVIGEPDLIFSLKGLAYCEPISSFLMCSSSFPSQLILPPAACIMFSVSRSFIR